MPFHRPGSRKEGKNQKVIENQQSDLSIENEKAVNEDEKEIESNDVLTKSNNEKETRKEFSDTEHSKST